MRMEAVFKMDQTDTRQMDMPESGNLPSHLTEDAVATDVIVALCISFAHKFLHTFFRRITGGFYKTFQHGDRCNAQVADAVFLAN